MMLSPWHNHCEDVYPFHLANEERRQAAVDSQTKKTGVGWRIHLYAATVYTHHYH